MKLILKNTRTQWGLVSVIIHWLTAITIICLFVLGLWMVELSYYDKWYQTAPHIHKSIGILLFALTVFRIFWLFFYTRPEPLVSHIKIETLLATVVHKLLYVLLFSIMISGYLISTADGSAIELFNWIKIPASISNIEHQEDIAGIIHFYLAITLVIVAGIHALGAIKHHFIDKDITLMRMFGK